MLSNRLTAFAIASLLLASVPAVAATLGSMPLEQNAATPGHSGKGHNDKLGGFFTPEQRAVFMLQTRDTTKTMSQEERRGFRKDQVNKVLAMSETDRQKLKTDLQARWEALPAAQKDRFEQRISQRAQNSR